MSREFRTGRAASGRDIENTRVSMQQRPRPESSRQRGAAGMEVVAEQEPREVHLVETGAAARDVVQPSCSCAFTDQSKSRYATA